MGMKCMKIEMTEIQKAYLIGREDAFSGGVGTHLYIELLYGGAIKTFTEALNKVIVSQPFLRAKISEPYCFEILEPFRYEIEVFEEEANDSQIIETLRSELSHKKYTREDFPLFTAKAVKEKEQYRIAFSIDLIIADGMSLYELIAEINDYMEHPDKVIVDYAEDLTFMMDYYHKSKKTKRYDRAKKYYLENIDTIYEAPKLNYVSNKERDVTFSHKEYELAKECYDKLKVKASENGFSVTDILLSVYAMILTKWSQNPEMSINVTAFKRPDGEVYRHVIGDFTTSMLVQSNFDEEKSFDENVKQIKMKLFTALKYQDFEVTQIVKELDMRGRSSLMPIVFTSMLFDEDSLLGENFVKDYIISQTPQVYLDCQAKNNAGKLSITWDYRNSKFTKKMIDSMFDEYCSCIEYYITQENDLVEHYNSTVQQHTSKLYEEFNGQTKAEQWEMKSLLTSFQETVNQYPDEVFAVIDGQEYTFNEVNQKAVKLAQIIKEAKVKSGKQKTRIAFSGSKSLHSLVSIVAAQMTGDSFCAVNEYFGKEKSDEVLKSIADYIVIENFEVKEISQEVQEIEQEESYILFTSGTTGKPKGIVIREDAALNTVYAMIKMYGVRREDACANISNLYFDLSIFDLYASMITGMKVYMVDAYNVNWFIEGECYKNVSIWNSTPALAREFLLHDTFDKLRCVFMSGDFIQKKLVEDLYKKYGEDLSVTALGGATEASIWSNYFNCKDYKDKDLIPYGHALPNQQMYVMKQNKMLAEVGVLGEIIIAGDGLATGYLDQKQTEHAFIWNEQLGKRIYRTGDLGYLGADNNIYILGRVVDEIKHNGYRIDLREIEKYIIRIDGVKNAFVFIEKLENQRTRLICTVVSDEEGIEQKIRKVLSKQVPHYMVPTNFLVVDAIPLTSNGKVNMPEIKNLLNNTQDVYSFSEKEKEVIEVCKELISGENFREPSHGGDTFFDMGGQSLQVVALKEKLDKHFHTDISLQDLMNHITIIGLCELVSVNEGEEKEKSQELILLRKGTKEDKNIIFIHAGSGEINIYLNLSRSISEEYNIYGIRYEPEVKHLALYNYDFRKIAHHYCDLAKDIKVVDYLGGWCIGGTIAYEMALHEPDKYKEIFMFNSMAPVSNKVVQMGDSFEDEVNFMKNFLSEELIQSCHNDTEKLWENIAELIDKNAEYRKAIINLIPPVLMRLLPKVENLSGKQLVYFINMFRSSENARHVYQSHDHADVNCYYFHAVDEVIDKYEDWKQYVSYFEDFAALGNHVTMFKDENLESLSKQFNSILSK